MARFTKKFKIECVKNYKNHIKLETPDGWKEDNFFNEVKRWSGYYDRFGGSAFDKKKPEITYKEMVAICKRIEKGDSLTKVATYYGRSRLTIKRYYMVYLHDGLAGIKLRLKRRNKEIKYMGELKIKKPETTDEINELESLKRKVELQNIEIEYLKKLSALVRKKKGPTTEEKVKVVDELRLKYELKAVLKIANLSKSTYFYYHGKKYLDSVNKRVEKDKQILKIVKPIYFKNKSRYGSRRIILSIPSKELERLNVGRDRIRRILKVNGLLGVQGRNQRYHSYKGDNGLEKINLLLTKIVNEKTNKVTYKRNFKADAPNQIWATDVSEFKIASGKVYLSPVLDLFDSSIVAYDVSLHPNLDQIKRMLKRSFSKNDKLEGLIFHSDQGWQYQNPFYVSELEKRGIKQSFSRKGNCMDNSKMENFFGIMKNEMFYGHEGEFKTLDELMKAIKQYINYYNNKRINVKRKGLSPIAYRQQSFEGVQFKN